MASHALRWAVRTRECPTTARSTVSIMPIAIERTERGISTRPLGGVLMIALRNQVMGTVEQSA
jgi:hypothetical protein